MASPWNRHCPGAPQTIEGASVMSGATQVRDPASQSLVGGLNYATMMPPLASGIARISLRGSDGDFGLLCSSQGALSAHQGPFSTQGGPCGRLQESPCSSSGGPLEHPRSSLWEVKAPCGRLWVPLSRLGALQHPREPLQQTRGLLWQARGPLKQSRELCIRARAPCDRPQDPDCRSGALAAVKGGLEGGLNGRETLMTSSIIPTSVTSFVHLKPIILLSLEPCFFHA